MPAFADYEQYDALGLADLVRRGKVTPEEARNPRVNAVIMKLYDLTGQPAMMLPLGRSENGLPVAVQLVAGRGGEATLFRLAAQLEQSRPWFDRRPPLAG